MFDIFVSPQQRYERRLARIARWDRPIAGRWDRIAAWANLLAADHGFFRLFYLNARPVSARLWRSAQPAPPDIRRFARRHGVRTIVYLRGGREHGAWALEKEACEREGLRLVEFVVRSRGAPDRDTILAAPDFFAGLEYPALVHCKSGADRAGFVAALWLILMEGRPVAEAMRQLAPRYGHFRWSKTGILDAFLERWAAEGEAAGMSFPEWVATRYDPVELERDFHEGYWSSLLVDRLLRRE